MIYFLVTTSIFNNCPIRYSQYINGINILKDVSKKMITNDNYEIILIENNGMRNTYLDKLGCKVFYTNNNLLPTQNRGRKELQDIFDCIRYFKINDDDFIVKLTGRYILDPNSEFMNIVSNLHNTKYDCIIKYGWYREPLNYKNKSCITGLIGLRCFYVKQIELPDENICVEWNWAKITYLINDEKIFIVDKLGINMCPASNTYVFL
jgi:hypothetical protein